MSCYEQEPPFCIQVEPVQGCNLMCEFCGINSIRKKAGGYKYMSLGLADLIGRRVAEIGWKARIELAMHGEPTLHPDLPGVISAIRQHTDNQIMVTCNGSGLLPDFTDSLEYLFKTPGTMVVVLDDYNHSKVGRKVDEAAIRKFAQFHRYPENRSASPHKRWSPDSKVFILVQDIKEASGGTHSTLSNHCGGGAPLNSEGAGKRCAKPFREMSIQWNGNVNICCNSFSGRYNCGNVRWMSLLDIWNSERMQVARKHLYNGMRTFKPCLGCDASSTRVGLLPDKKGQESLPVPTKEEQELAKAWGRVPTTKEVRKAVWKDEDTETPLFK